MKRLCVSRKFLLASSALAVGLASVPARADVATASDTPVTSSAKPKFGTFGFDVGGMDRSVSPGDDFYRFANGAWLQGTEIPADRAAWGAFDALRELSDQRIRSVIQSAAASQSARGSTERKIGDFFASFMDEAAIEARGITPIAPQLEQISAIATRADLSRELGEANRDGVATPFGVAVIPDLKDNSRYAAYLGQGGLGLPDRDYYLKDDPKFVEMREKYRAHIANLLRLAGISAPEERAQGIYELERQIAQGHWTVAESRQVDKIYNPVSVAALPNRMPGLDWSEFLSATGLSNQDSLVVFHPSALEKAASLVSSVPLQTWKDYLTFHTIKAASPLLPKAFVEEDFAFDGPVLAGTPELKERWKRGVDLVNGGMGEAVGQLYVAKYFPPESKAKAENLVNNLIAAMDHRLQQLSWMAPETKVKAREKLAAFRAKIGYPDKWRDYSGLRIDRADAYGNALRSMRFAYQWHLDKLGKSVDRNEWGMTPQTVNAYANPLMNEIVFPAAILQPPFFDPNADPAVNYGAMGAVIGHEISHHFDDQGRKFDPAGELSEWWTPEDVARFAKLSSDVVRQYSGYSPLPGMNINGELTLGENIADLAGLNIAYDAYKLSLNGKPAPVIGGFTGDQRFFLGFAQVHRKKYRDATMRKLLTTDEHTPGNYRPYVVRNVDSWYRAFDVEPEDTLYLDPAERIRIW